VTWRVIGDVTAMLGGIRALLIQSAHPEVVAGVAEHSSYRDDPLGRLSRTTAYVTATAYGAMPEVEAALRVVRRAHQPVEGVSERNVPYSANDTDHASWVHNVLVDSFLTAYRTFGPSPLTEAEADQFVIENQALGKQLRALDLPGTANSLSDWVANHPDVAPSEAMFDTLSFLADPPLPRPANVGYRRLFAAALTTIPDPIRSVLGQEPARFSGFVGSATMSMLRWSLGASPSWWLALERSGAALPPDVRFRRPPPINGIEARFAASLAHADQGSHRV
jgi:uncharacterized protein (DUF2236 family)